MFLMYTSASGNNVTLSPRLGQGHVMPQFDSGAQVTLLEGSGVSNGMMTANVRCSNCDSWKGGSMDLTDDNGDFIWAYQSGRAMNTDDQSAGITQHASEGRFELDFAQARGGNTANPFLDSTDELPYCDEGSTSGTESNGALGPGVSGFAGLNFLMQRNILIAHGVLGCLAFGVLFPVGAIIIRILSFPGLIWLHAGLQVLTWLVFVACFGLGIYMATTGPVNMLDKYHPIIGIVLFVLLFFQPILGMVHHTMFKKYGTRTAWSHGHLWNGRIIITLGIINGGLGFMLAGNTQAGYIIFAIVAGIMWVLYVIAAVLGERKRARKAPPKYEDRSPPGPRRPSHSRHPQEGAALCQIFDSIFLDVAMSKVRFNVNTEYAYIQNFKVLQNAFTRHHIEKIVPVEALVKCKMQDNLEFLQWAKRYWDQYYPGGEYDALARRKGSGAPAATASSARAPATGARRAAPGAAPRTRTPQGGGAPSAALVMENNQLKETVAGLERERDFYFSKLRDIELLIQTEMETHPELEEVEDGILKQIQNILYSTEDGFEIPQEEGEVQEEETF
ncbi:hypothetical protein P152DRAFT_464116 [Eremomyces bilateralis CBS 781.70]|uniref:EB1 C-terminal domain-containing protein n=1 Tax=Eremomyces bilateralis CBS 781.70 TaxID=1392243 RepID=A0A6G1GEW1_9PEZI|nr:uncharacterized protein P152DRAFT_464116 [Eremomyces bilateralis CBS 781.70]KAF1816617.1 hypothetical protein P152DRAFT_464116 [Eremomyces bilateralis CBS 781.70]